MPKPARLAAVSLPALVFSSQCEKGECAGVGKVATAKFKIHNGSMVGEGGEVEVEPWSPGALEVRAMDRKLFSIGKMTLIPKYEHGGGDEPLPLSKDCHSD